MNANEFTWEQRGAIDNLLGVPYRTPPASDLFERQQWEKGWLAQEKRNNERDVHVAFKAVHRVLAVLPRK